MLQDETQFKALNGSGGGGSGSGVMVATAPITPSQGGTENFDLSVLQGLRDSDKYLGRNTVSDIRSTYQTYITGNPIGRGGKYAVDSAKKYGTSIVDAARGYLIGAGIPLIPSVIQTQTQTQTDTTTKQDTNIQQKNPFEVLADILPSLFGNAVYNPPLQSQAYGYSPTATEQPLTQATGGSSSIGLLIIVGVVGIAGYFIYKRFSK